MNQSFIFLLLIQSVIQSANILFSATGSLIGLSLSKNESLSTIPIFLNVLFTLAMTIPASFLFEKYGRKKVFLFGLLLGIISIFIFVSGIYYNHFLIFCIASAMLGLSASIANYLRYSAIEISKPEFKSRAGSLILTGGVLAAFIGPNLSIWGLKLIPFKEFLGGYIVFFLFFSIAMILIQFVKFPEQKISNEKKLDFKNLLKNKLLQKIILLSMISYWVMVFIMTATPLGMNHFEYSRESIVKVLQYHILGMFVPSFFTGNLIKKFGVWKIMNLGCILFFVCVGINFTHHSNHHYIPSLILLGIGWNFLFVSTTFLLSTKISSENQSKSQALNDFMVFSFIAITVAFTGTIHRFIGYQNLNLITIPFIFLAVYLIFQLRKEEKSI